MEIEVIRHDNEDGRPVDSVRRAPERFLSYPADGRMRAIGTANGSATHHVVPTDYEPMQLHRTMLAYADTCSVETDKTIHHVNCSWSQICNGTDQVRFYKLSRETLTSAREKRT